MKTVDLIQGTDLWKEHRAKHFNASDAAAMMGMSKYKTRAQLLKEMATGIVDEIDDATQDRFDAGHRFEALARPLAEEMIGDSLSPVTGTNGKYSASFDGITFDESVIWEHKTLNAKLIACKNADDLHVQYLMQMEHQLMVSGAQKCLFMASRFDEDANLDDEVHFWYSGSPELRKQIIAGWEQFEKDLTNYQHTEVVPEVIATPVMELPALSIQVNGSISLISNLEKFGARLNEFVVKINKEPSDDQGFADAESAIKTLQAAQDALESAENNALAQTSDIDDMRKMVKLYADTARTTRLMLEKMVKVRKESIRIEIVTNARNEFGEHCFLLMNKIKPIILNIDTPDFANSIKGKKTIASLCEAAATALRNGKIEADMMADDILAKLDWFNESSSGYGFLFSDLQSIISRNSMEAFQAIVQRRIDDHKSAEAAKLEQQRIAIQHEEEAKEKAIQEAVLSAERANIESEIQAIVRRPLQSQTIKKYESDGIASEQAANAKMFEEVAKAESEAHCIEEIRRRVQLEESAKMQGKTIGDTAQIKPARPDDYAIIEEIAHSFDVSYDTACEWIISVAENLKKIS